jgi:hypothetical protein
MIAPQKFKKRFFKSVCFSGEIVEIDWVKKKLAKK